MKTPNLFKRDGNVITWGTLDPNAETIEYNEKTDFNRLDVEVIERFTNIDENGDPFANARLKLSIGNIEQTTIAALPIWIGSGSSATPASNLDEVLSFFFTP